jgi:hypothetical protein
MNTSESFMRTTAIGRGLRGVLITVAWLGAASCSRDAADANGLFRWTISTSVEIDEPPARVWNVLVDLPAYREWNPFIVEASGTLAVGETLSLRMVLPDRDPLTIEPVLLVVEPERELRWKGRLLIPGLFDGEHAFALTALENGRTRLDHWEHFRGLLLPIARGMVYDATLQAFHALNAALAKRAAEPDRAAPRPLTRARGSSSSGRPGSGRRGG